MGRFLAKNKLVKSRKTVWGQWVILFICNYVKRLLVYCDGWRCMRSTPRNDRGSTNGWHCKWDQRQMKLRCLVSCVFFDIICVAWLNRNGIFFQKSFRALVQHCPAWRTWLQTEHTKDQDAETDDPAKGAHQGSTAGLCSFRWVSKNSFLTV